MGAMDGKRWGLEIRWNIMESSDPPTVQLKLPLNHKMDASSTLPIGALEGTPPLGGPYRSLPIGPPIRAPYRAPYKGTYRGPL